MTHLPEFENQCLEFIPNFAYPLGVSDIRRLADTKKAFVELEFQADNPIVNGIVKSGSCRVSSTINFGEDTKIFGLVCGGWLPLPFVTPQQFLVDRNVVSALKKIRNGENFNDIASFQWWTKFFDNGTAIFNPLPYAFESGLQRTPTISEFRTSFQEGVSELIGAFPKCKVIRYDDDDIFDAVYSQLRAFDERNENEINFLMAACPIICERKTGKNVEEALDAILTEAKRTKVARGSFALIAVLSCLYESKGGSPESVGRQLLKPKRIYTETQAYNAISDLRHIKLLIVSHSYFKEREFALCTRDIGLALFWSALSISSEVNPKMEIICNLNLSSYLFERLSLDEIEILIKRIKE
jgi:hypothetical protein